MITKLDITQYNIHGVDVLELVGTLSLIDDFDNVFYNQENVVFQFDNQTFLAFLKEVVKDSKFHVTWFGAKLYIDEEDRLYCNTEDNTKRMFFNR